MLPASGLCSARGRRVSFIFTLVTGPIRSLNLKLSDTRVYAPQIRARSDSTQPTRRLGRLAGGRSHSACLRHPTTRVYSGKHNKTLLKGFVRLRGTCSPLRFYSVCLSILVWYGRARDVGAPRRVPQAATFRGSGAIARKASPGRLPV